MAYHFDTKQLEFNTEGRGIAIPTILVMLGAPVLGAVFLMFMPFIGFYLCLETLFFWCMDRCKGVFAPAPVPGEAHLTGTPPRADGYEPGSSLRELEEHIARKRGQ